TRSSPLPALILERLPDTASTMSEVSWSASTAAALSWPSSSYSTFMVKDQRAGPSRGAIIIAAMDYVRLGDSGLMVSLLCLGTMMFGDRTDAETSARIIASAHEAGVNFIDTADVYTKGASEKIVGPAIKPHRDE